MSTSFEPTKQIAEPTVTVAVSVMVRSHRIISVTLARQGRPVRLGSSPLAGLDFSTPEQPQLKSFVGEVGRQRLRQTDRRRPLQIVLDRRARHAQSSPDLARAHPTVLQPQQQLFAIVSSRFASIAISSSTIDGRDSSVADSRGANGMSHSTAQVAGFISEWWPTSNGTVPASNRNWWPDCVGIRS